MSATPFDQRDGWIWFDGQIVPWKDAKVHVLTHGLHYGSLRVRGRARLWRRDLQVDRAHRASDKSAEILDFRFPTRSPRSMPPSASCSKKNGLTDAYVRPVAWRGSRDDGRRGAATTRSISPSRSGTGRAISTRRRSSRASGSTWPSTAGPIRRPRRPRQGGRPLHDLHHLQARAEAKGYADALMLDWRGHVAEGTGANVFFIKDGEIHTPTPTASSTASPARR